MAFKFHRDAIITGDIDAFCLACERYLSTEEELCSHIDQPSHRYNSDRVPYVEKFKGDGIRKFKMGYYCEFCNLLFSIASKVNLHITEDDHNYKKGTLLLKSDGTNLIAFENVLIQAQRWHGIFDNLCVICDIEMNDDDIHRSTQTHLINLVQKPVKFGINNAVYRQVDDGIIHCLTCDRLLTANTMTEHFNDSEHIVLYKTCQRGKNENGVLVTDNVQIINEQSISAETAIPRVFNNDTKEKKITDENKSSKDDKYKIIDSIDVYQKNALSINLEMETAFCKRCWVNIKFDYRDLESHISNHASINNNIDSSLVYPLDFDRNLNRVDLKKQLNVDLAHANSPICELPCSDLNLDENRIESRTEDISETKTSTALDVIDKESDNANPSIKDPSKITFAKINKITYNKSHNKAFCRVCEKKIPSSLECMKQHVSGALHNKKVKSYHGSASVSANKMSNAAKVLKMPMQTFIKSKYFVETFTQIDAVVNEQYCVSLLSFLMITKTGSRFRCQVCEVNLPSYDTDGRIHGEESRHDRAMDRIPVVTSLSSEFIREVRFEIFHCGYCNMVTGDWSQTQEHLECTEHKTEKGLATYRLQMHLPKIERHKKESFGNAMLWMLGRRFY